MPRSHRNPAKRQSQNRGLNRLPAPQYQNEPRLQVKLGWVCTDQITVDSTTGAQIPVPNDILRQIQYRYGGSFEEFRLTSVNCKVKMISEKVDENVQNGSYISLSEPRMYDESQPSPPQNFPLKFLDVASFPNSKLLSSNSASAKSELTLVSHNVGIDTLNFRAINLPGVISSALWYLRVSPTLFQISKCFIHVHGFVTVQLRGMSDENVNFTIPRRLNHSASFDVITTSDSRSDQSALEQKVDTLSDLVAKLLSK